MVHYYVPDAVDIVSYWIFIVNEVLMKQYYSFLQMRNLRLRKANLQKILQLIGSGAEM